MAHIAVEKCSKRCLFAVPFERVCRYLVEGWSVGYYESKLVSAITCWFAESSHCEDPDMEGCTCIMPTYSLGEHRDLVQEELQRRRKAANGGGRR